MRERHSFRSRTVMDPAVVPHPRLPPMTFDDGLGRGCGSSIRAQRAGGHALSSRRADAVPAFEFALRERVGRLATFRHPCYAAVRSVERLKDPGRRSRSCPTSPSACGCPRCSRFAEAADITLDIDAALCLLRQLVPAVAMLHETCPTSRTARSRPSAWWSPRRAADHRRTRARSALEQLRCSHERYWRELRIAVPRFRRLPRFDHRADVTQIGIVALSLILGRPLHDEEDPAGWRCGRFGLGDFRRAAAWSRCPPACVPG